MDTTNPKTGNRSQNRKWVFPIGVAAIAICSIVVVSCFHDSDDPTVVASDTTTPLPDEPVLQVVGGKLYCDAVAPTVDIASGLYPEAPNSIAKSNISKDLNTGDDTNPESWNNHNSGNNVQRMSRIVTVTDDPDGIPDNGDEVLVDVHPLIVSYGEQVIGDYEGGDGSADIGDPYSVDDIFVSMSLDNGRTWKKIKVGDTAKSSHIFVNWGPNGSVAYPGHSHKPTMAIEGDNVLVAWNDKYCPSGDPFDLYDDDGNLIYQNPDGTFQDDTFKVNGSQGTIDYAGVVAPNGKTVYEVPYSCVWTARGVLSTDTDLNEDGIVDDADIAIQWRQAQQMTSGTRDSNKIWIAPAKGVGFAIAWQEDPDGLRPGKGEGPGDGWSGATTNHGADIWYTYIKGVNFDDVCGDFDCTSTLTDPTPADIVALLDEKPKPAVNFTYPVRITNNEVCSSVDAQDPETSNKPWCVDHCDSTVSITSQSGNPSDRCVQNDIDYMVPDSSISETLAVLDGDTGASRPALKLLRTDAPLDADGEPEVIAILAYEETKGLSESDPASQTDETDIALEGKAVYFESFFWEEPVEVSAGRPVNMYVPEKVVAVDQTTGAVTTEAIEIYENARRVVIMPQVDPCEQGERDPTFALLYKQGYDTQGGPSDMFIRVNYGFTYDDFGPLPEQTREVTNVSSHGNTLDPYVADAGPGAVLWTTANLDDQSYTYALDNTFSPRGWLRGGEVYTGFEYSPLWRATSTGTVPNNFWMNSYVDGIWTGTKQLSMVTGPQVSTLDPRFIPTPAGEDTSIASDASDPKVIFLGYGTFDMSTTHELDLHYMRSTDKGVNWEYLDESGNIVLVDSNPLTSDGFPGTGETGDDAKSAAKLAAFGGDPTAVIEMELQGLASPDGTMYFGVWNEESFPGPVLEGDAHNYGLESRAGVVVYDDTDPAAAVPVE